MKFETLTVGTLMRIWWLWRWL